MGKIILGLYVIILIITVGFVWNKSSYYAYIETDGKITNEKINNGQASNFHNYEVEAFDSKGEKKELVVQTNYNLRNKTYLKIVTNKSKRIIRWKEIEEKDIPRHPLKKIEHEKLYSKEYHNFEGI